MREPCHEKHTPPPAGGALTVAETAERLHLSEATVYRLARAGALPGAARVGRSWRVDGARLSDLFGGA